MSSRHSRASPPSTLFEELEPRLLLSADGLAGLDALVSSDERELGDAAGQVLPAHQEFSPPAASEVPPASTEAADRRHEIVFVDGGIEDHETLVAGFLGADGDERRIDVVVLDPTRDGIQQITDVLAGYNDLDAVHVLSHGDDASLRLGSTTLDGESLERYREAIAGWAGALDTEADLLLYGCNLAAGEDGRALISTLATLTGADVAASDDLTGSAELGGDWALEFTAGAIETKVAPGAEAQAQWSNVLAAPAEDSFEGYPLGPIGGNGGGTGWAAGSWSSPSVYDINVVAGGLAPPSGGPGADAAAVELDAQNHAFNFATYSARELVAPLGAATETVWASFLLEPADTNSGSYFGIGLGNGVSFNTSTQMFAGYKGSDFILENVGGGLSHNAPGAATGVTAFLVLKLDLSAGAGNDTATLYVNPTAGAATPDVAASVIKSDMSVDTLSHIALIGGTDEAANPARIDQIRFGSSYADVAPTASTPAPNSAPSFGTGPGDGIVNTSIGAADQGTSVTVQPDGKLLVAGISDDTFTLTRYNADGTLDPSFSGDGKLTTDMGAGSDYGMSVTLQPDGKILVAGSSGGNFALARYDVDGSLDLTFDVDGKVRTDILPGADYGRDVTLQADGKILVAGYNQSNVIVLVRYEASGALDSTFDGGTVDGIVTTAIGTAARGESVTVQGDGKILVAGRGYPGANEEFAVVRYNTDGTLDSTFGGDGIVTTAVGSIDRIFEVIELPTGQILAVGSSWNGSDVDLALVRYNPEGSLDVTFDGGAVDGIVTTDIGSADDWGYSATLQTDGKIVVAGSSGSDFAVVRYKPNGSLDTDFGAGGKLITNLGAANDEIGGVTVLADGTILAAGRSGTDFAIARYNADGTPNTDFDLSSTLDGNPTFVEDGAAIVLDADVVVSDAELSVADNFDGATLTLARNGGANGEDQFSATGTLGALSQGGNLVVGATTIGTVTTNSGGTLTLTFNSAATNALVNSAMRQIAYGNSNNSPPANVQIDWTFDDGNAGAQGTGGALAASGSTMVNITAVDDPLSVATTGNTVLFTEDAGATTALFAAAMDTVETADTISQVVLTLANVEAGDTLVFGATSVDLNTNGPTGPDANGFTYAVSSAGATPVVTITHAGADDATVNTMLNSLVFNNTANNDPSTTARTVTLTSVTDSGSGLTADGTAATVTVAAVNDAPAANNDNYAVDEDGALDVDWSDTAWTVRQTLTFNNSLQGEDLIDFPVLVVLESVLDSGTVDYTNTQSNGADLRFFAADGTALAYDIEEWNHGGTSYVWVKVPQITAGSTTDYLTMYYGNAGASAGENAEAVWSNGFQSVQHLNDDLQDASANSNDGVNSGSTNATGQVADGQLFDGTDDYVNLGSDPTIDDVFAGGGTVSAWIKPTGWGENGYGRVFDKSNSTFPSAGWALELAQGTTSLLFQQGFSGSIGSWTSSSATPISLGPWQHVSVSYDSSSPSNVPTFYINGALVPTVVDATPTGTAVGDGGYDLHVGNFSQATTRTFNGVIDDVRVVGEIRSADWARAQFLSTSNSFVGFSGEEATPITGGILTNDTDAETDPLTTSLVSGPTDAASFNLNQDGTFTYTPADDFNGVDSFTYMANDGTEDSNVATVTITVNAVNDAPTVAATASDTGTEDIDQVYTHAEMLTLIGAGDIDDANANLSVAITNVFNGTVALSGGSGGPGTLFTFTPDSNFVGDLTFDYEVSDDEAPTPASSAVGTATVSLSAADDPLSVATTGNTVLFTEDAGATTALFAATMDTVESGDTISQLVLTLASVEAGDTLVFGATSVDLNTNGASGPDANGFTYTVSSAGANPVVTISHAGADDATVNTMLNSLVFDNTTNEDPSTTARTVTLTSVTDSGSGLTNDGTAATVNVATVNDAPVATADPTTTDEDTPVDIDVLANDSDPEGDTLSVLDVSNPFYGSVVNNGDGTVTYTPDNNFTGADSFTYVATDLADTVSYWRLDGDATDAVGSNHGAITGTTTIAGVYGNALSFDEVDDKAVVPDFDFSDAFSLSFQLKIDENSGTNYQYMYSHGTVGDPETLNIFLGETGNANANLLRTQFNDSNDIDDRTALEFDVSSIIGDGLWHTYTLTVATGSGSSVYLDGMLQNSDARGGDSFDPTTDIFLGAREDLNANRFYGGSLDSVQLFNRALLAGEVSDVHTGGTALGTVNVTIDPTADTPSITNATTNEDTQSTTGLVISRNVVDGAEVTHFKITGIANGTLYKNDGTTQITNGSFITFGEGNAGLKFTPTADFNGNGSFTIQASISNADSGLGGGTVGATITVSPADDPLSVATTGNTVLFTEDAGATTALFAAAMDTVETGDTISQLVLTLANVEAGDTLVFGATSADLNTDGVSGPDANGFTYTVSSAGATPVVTISHAGADDATVNTMLNSLVFNNTSNNDPSTTARTVTFTSVTDSGSGLTADGTVATVNVAKADDSINVSTSGNTVLFTEDAGATTALFAAAMDTVETGDTVSQVVLTLANVEAGDTLVFGATSVDLNTDGTSGPDANGFTYTVSSAGATPVVTISHAGADDATVNTMLNSLVFNNTSNNDPSTTARTVTLTSVTDSGSGLTADGTVATVNVAKADDPLVVSTTGNTVLFTEGAGATAALFAAAIDTVETGDTISQVILTLANVEAGDLLRFGPTSVDLNTNGASGPDANGFTYTVSSAGASPVVTVTHAGADDATVNTMLNSLVFNNTSNNDPSTTARTVTLTSVTDLGSGLTADGTVATVNVAKANDPLTVATTGNTVLFTEDAGATTALFAAAMDTVESGDTVTQVVLTLANVEAGDTLVFGATSVVLNTNGPTGPDANGFTYTISSAGASPVVTITHVGADDATINTMLNSLVFNNTSNNDPNTTARTVTLTSVTDSGSGLTADGTVATVNVAKADDPLVVSTTGNTVLFTEDAGATTALFAAAMGTVESGDTITQVVLTLANVEAGDTLSFGATSVDLNTNAATGPDANGFAYTVSSAGASPVVTISHAAATDTLTNTMLNSLVFNNTSNNDPSTTARTVTLTSVTDSGSGLTADGTVATVNVAKADDPINVATTGNTVLFTEDAGATTALFAAAMDTVETGDNVSQLVLTLANVEAGDTLSFGATSVDLNTNAASGPDANGFTYAVSSAGASPVVTITHAGASDTVTNTMLNSLVFNNTSNDDPSTTARSVTLTSVTDSGSGLTNDGTVATVNVAVVDDPLSVATTGNTVLFTEDAGATTALFAAAMDTVEAGDTVSQVVLTLANVEAGDTLVFGATSVDLNTDGASGPDANGFTYTVSSAGATPVVTITHAGASDTLTSTMLNSLVFNNTSNNDPSTTARTVTLTSVTDSGSGLTTDGTVATVNVAKTNDAPTVSLINVVTGLPETTSTATAIKIADIVIADVDPGTNNLTLTGDDFARFEIVGAELRLRAGTSLDYEIAADVGTDHVFDVTVEVDDPGAGATPDGTAATTLTVTDVNENPSGTGTLTTTGLNDNVGATSLFGGLAVSDPDAGENDLSLTIQLTIPGAGTITGGGFTETGVGTGIYSVGGLTVAQADAALVAARFTPTDNTGPSGSFTTDIGVTVNDQGGGGDRDVLSPTTITITRVNSAPTGLPVITGNPIQSQVLTAATGGIADAEGLGLFTFQWLRDGVPVDAATGSNYTLSGTDLSSNIAVRVDYTDGEGAAESITSAAVGPVGSAPVPVTADVPEDLPPPADNPEEAGIPQPLDEFDLSAVLPPTGGPVVKAGAPETGPTAGTFTGDAPADRTRFLERVVGLLDATAAAEDSADSDNSGGKFDAYRDARALLNDKPRARLDAEVPTAPEARVEAGADQALMAEVGKMQIEMATSGDTRIAEEVFRQNMIKGTLGTLSVGTVTWLLRAGSLLAGVFSSIPMWSSMDPLPILALSRRERKRRQKEMAEAGDRDASEQRMNQILDHSGERTGSRGADS